MGDKEIESMKAARTVQTILAVCLSCTLSMSGDVEPTVDPGKSGPEETYSSYLQKSVESYDAGDYQRSLQAAEDALGVVTEQTAVVYNNICSAQMMMGEYDKAARACSKALEIAPGYERAWNNLAWIYEKVVEETPTAGAYLDLSVARYWQDQLDESVAAARQVLELDPINAIAHNNICSALAKGGEWDRAIVECEMALAIDPDYERAKNNLDWARTRTAR